MEGFNNSVSMCPVDQHCSQWAEENMSYCLCSTRDVISLTLGVISVLSWGVAEVPQLITNYKEKSVEGLSLMFITTWILGDLLNLIGCKLEPATLPTQYYMALLYTVTTFSLATQTIYYGHIYPRLKANKRHYKIDNVEKRRPHSDDIDKKQADSSRGLEIRSQLLACGVAPSIPIPLLSNDRGSVGGEFYYTSARSLSRSHTPTCGFYMPKRSSSGYECIPTEESLFGEHDSTQSTPPSKTKSLMCAVSTLTFFLSISNLRHVDTNAAVMQNQGYVVHMGRKLLQVNESLLIEYGSSGAADIGSYLGWGMAIIYMGGRLPQIFLNFRRGHVEGLNPLMFIFALVGNITYVGSILVSSLDWAKLRPNLPWLVDAGGCVFLDTLILVQFIYFWYHPPQNHESKDESSNIT
ncbi:hypothetical protein ACET3Z_023484 [Daucus carota]